MSEPIVLTDFQRWLTTSKGFTTTQAIDVCTEHRLHEVYVRLWSEFESKNQCDGGSQNA